MPFPEPGISTLAVKILKEFGHHHNHALSSTTDPNLFLIPEDRGIPSFHQRTHGLFIQQWCADTSISRLPQWTALP